jgi:hypothetical protein
MAAEAVASAAPGTAELAAATAMGGLAEALANDSAARPAEAQGAGRGNPAKAAPLTARATKPATRPSRKSAPRKPAKPSK